MIELLLNGRNELELRAAAVEVVLFAVDFEIDVALQIVREETDADFQRDKFA